MLTASKCILVQCDPSIRALILQINDERPGIVIDELDDTHLLVKSDKVDIVKQELNKLLSKNIYNPFDEE
ncbi:RNA polymerase II transcription factor B subunit 5 [Scheffersomyces amazonensis]|uniref:RNA polymerase II transcription factor B subunit 5 n=1 Tax=Scheffersomyces amazonensis TaxID=1078765 RepID=UPI00315D9E18